MLEHLREKEKRICLEAEIRKAEVALRSRELDLMEERAKVERDDRALMMELFLERVNVPNE
jgi:hypothetical protein